MSDSDRSVRDRRVSVLLVVAILALLGAGLGTVVFDDDGQPGIETPTPDETVELDLSVVEDETLLTVSDVAPSHTGTTAVTLRNDGSGTGVVRIANLSVTQQENGIFGPEASVDNATSGAELADNLLVSLSLQTPDVRRSLYRTADGRPLSEVVTETPSKGVRLGPGETTTFVLQWEVPATTGNVIQSDSLRLDVAYELVDPNATTPQQ